MRDASIRALICNDDVASLRRAVLHPNLVLGHEDESGRLSSSRNALVNVDDLIKDFTAGEPTEGSKNVFAENFLTNIEKDDGQECPICFDIMQAPMIIPKCLHQW